MVDGAYAAMLTRILAPDAPALILLHYHCVSGQEEIAWSIKRVVAIPPVFLTRAVVEARKPLSVRAKRAGWQGCNLRVDRIPPEGQIEVVDNGIAVDPATVRRLYDSSRRLATIHPDVRGWTSLVLNIIRRMGVAQFQLREIYAKKESLEEAFPNNRNVEAKIRQQLQVLRDLGYLHFSGTGKYEVIS